MKIPYGISNFAELRREGFFYVDKTGFLPELESAESGNRYLLFLRPRRFGKSLFISTLEHYYDIAKAPLFDELFSGLAIHKSPTPLKNQFLVLRLDFSSVDTESGRDRLQQTFFGTVRAAVWLFLTNYQALVPSYTGMLARLDRIDNTTNLMTELFAVTMAAGRRIYLLIDEYDSFANELIARHDTKLYQDVGGGPGFVRTFYKTLKQATGGGAISRIFVTGVSPITLDDLASGFNITAQISLDPRFNALCGFTPTEVKQALDQFIARTPQYGSSEQLLADLVRSYNGYRFARQAQERLCNPDMVLYFLMELRRQGGYPQDLLDVNVRTDYGKLRQIATPPGGAQDWHRDLLETIVSEGSVVSSISARFGVQQLYERQHLISLLYFMGLLTIGGTEGDELRLEVPNTVIRTMHWEELIFILRQQAGVVVDTISLREVIFRMAYDGEIEPFLALMQERVMTVLSNRDLMHFDEKHIKMILLSYLSLSLIYRPLSEKEMAQGYSDLFLALDRRFPDARYAYLLELKHVKTGASEEEIAAARAAAEEQIERYLSDGSLLPALMGERAIKAVALVFIGAKSYRCWEVRTVGGRTG